MKTFRITPRPASLLYAVVHLCESPEEFDRVTETTGLGGLVRSEDRIHFAGGRQKTHPKFADVYLRRQNFGTGVVSHEMFHLTMAYLRRRKWPLQMNDDCDEYEEKVAWIHGNFMRQTTIGLLKHYPNG